MPFIDRQDAGIRVAEDLKKFADEDVVVFGLPRGGVVVGYEVAKELKAPLDAIVAKKIGLPGFPEFAIGAIAPGGVQILNQEAIQKVGLPDEILQQEAKKAEEEMRREIKLYREEKEMPNLLGKTAIIVDDGMATGLTALAAIESIGKLDALRVILAMPVCSADSADALVTEVTELVCLEKPYGFVAVGQSYQEFDQVSDKEVIELLQKAKTFRRSKNGNERRNQDSGR